ncbi:MULTISPECIES: DUF2550 domain-containing protein [Rhodococcus]|uniref:DUF2550 domain-containing protein n=1 Tax=Rhodococcus TaxID=1827 RepID=UPI000A72435C|nr:MULTISPECIES: DUF2550 domain-containing protein [Rhodococcus]
MTVLFVLVVLLAALVAAFVYRLGVLRRGGTAAIVRATPAAAGQGWRHGVIRYGEEDLVFYKLSSLRPGPDSRISRQGIEVGDRRGPRDTEFDIMTDEIVILSVQDGDHGYEVALDSGALTAFLSWVESRPSGRSMRGRPA